METETMNLHNKDSWVNIVPVLSIRHLPNRGSLKDVPPFDVCSNGFAVFVCIHAQEELPVWLQLIAQWVVSTYGARASWIRFEQDGDVIDGLWQYDWEENDDEHN